MDLMADNFNIQVEHALRLCSNSDYDFVTSKLILKADPSHLLKRPSTNMFAFSESTWKPRIEFYLEKGISNLEDKDWKNVMKAVAEYSTFVTKPATSSTKKASGPTEEELELEWDADSDDQD
jgi:hypothetical protein